MITLKGGKGSCKACASPRTSRGRRPAGSLSALSASQLASGSHPLVASYAGSASFTGSSSAQRMLTVTK